MNALSVGFPGREMSSVTWYGRRFRTLNVVDDFNREALAIAIDCNLPANASCASLTRKPRNAAIQRIAHEVR
jgi:hypothetical protein